MGAHQPHGSHSTHNPQPDQDHGVPRKEKVYVDIVSECIKIFLGAERSQVRTHKKTLQRNAPYRKSEKPCGGVGDLHDVADISPAKATKES